MLRAPALRSETSYWQMFSGQVLMLEWSLLCVSTLYCVVIYILLVQTLVEWYFGTVHECIWLPLMPVYYLPHLHAGIPILLLTRVNFDLCRSHRWVNTLLFFLAVLLPVFSLPPLKMCSSMVDAL